MSLLEKAKNVKGNGRKALEVDEFELIELAIAYAKHEVSSDQAASALGKPVSNAITLLAGRLMTAARRGFVTVTLVKDGGK